MKRRLLALAFALGIGALAPLTVASQGAQAKAEDHIWYCVGIDPPVDMSYCQHNPFAYPPLSGDPTLPGTPRTPRPPKAPISIPVPVPSI